MNYSIEDMVLDLARIAREADFPFVTKKVEPRVSVARDLTSYLEAWEASETLAQEQADLTQAKTEADFVTDVFAGPLGDSSEQGTI